MITIGYLLIAVLAGACLVFAARAYLNEPNKMLLLILCPTSLLWFDSFAIAVGQYVGEGSLLLGSSYIRYLAHWLMLPLLFIVAGMILRGAEFKFASSKYVMQGFVDGAKTLWVHSVCLQYFLSLKTRDIFLSSISIPHVTAKH